LSLIAAVDSQVTSDGGVALAFDELERQIAEVSRTICSPSWLCGQQQLRVSNMVEFSLCVYPNFLLVRHLFSDIGFLNFMIEQNDQ
jgi:hypothetical protein